MLAAKRKKLKTDVSNTSIRLKIPNPELWPDINAVGRIFNALKISLNSVSSLNQACGIAVFENKFTKEKSQTFR